jgi:hypothetical protein
MQPIDLAGGYVGIPQCLDLFTLEEFMQALERFPIRALTQVG